MGRKGFSKKVASYRVNLISTWIVITKINEKTKEYEEIYEKDFNQPRPDLYRYLDSAKKIKEFMK